MYSSTDIERYLHRQAYKVDAQCHYPSSGHGDKVGGLAWHPRATLSQGEDLVNLVSGAGDFDVNLWSLSRLEVSSFPSVIIG